jgi:spermidine dehydrogenase
MPGGRHLGVAGFEWLRGFLGRLADPYIHHFPDGNASIARLLVRSLIPEVADAVQPPDLVTSHFDYGQLDRPTHNVRIRLSSTAVSVQQSEARVTVRYVRGGQQFQATSGSCVLACYNAMIPYLCPDLPEVQRTALAKQVKVPLVYTNVVLRQWRALKELGIGQCFAPNMFHQNMMVDFPVSMGSYRFSPGPDEPVVLHLSSAFGQSGLPPADQFRIGRARLLGTSYADIEADILNFLDQLLGQADFDGARDIAAITVNRWPHGYAHGRYPLHDPEYPPGEAPHEIGRRTRGRVAIANSDAGARAYLDEAIDQAHRAVGELI